MAPLDQFQIIADIDMVEFPMTEAENSPQSPQQSPEAENSPKSPHQSPPQVMPNIQKRKRVYPPPEPCTICGKMLSKKFLAQHLAAHLPKAISM
jgi:hypothetical protein